MATKPFLEGFDSDWVCAWGRIEIGVTHGGGKTQTDW